MKEQKDHSIYSADDIKRYLTGDMSPVEMYAIEKAALDDSLLAEAIEGYELMEQKDWSKELTGIKQTLDNNEKDEAAIIHINQNKTFKWWKAAAAVLVIGTAATTAYFATDNYNNATKPEIVSNETLATTTDSAIALLKKEKNNALANEVAPNNSNNPFTKLPTAPNSRATEANAKEPSSSSTTAKAENSHNSSDSNFIYRPDKTSDGLIAMKDDKAPANGGTEHHIEKDLTSAPGNNSNMENAVELNNVVVQNHPSYEQRSSKINTDLKKGVAETSTMATEAIDNAYKRPQQILTGKVLGIDSEPIGYASIKIDGGKKAVQSDAEGNFFISTADTSLNVTVFATGHIPQKYNLNKNEALNNIFLQPHSTITESISVSKKATKAKSQNASIDSTSLTKVDEAMPVGGWDKYQKYLIDNLRFPKAAKQKNIHGEVVLSATLSMNGDILKVNTEKPLCPECDAEAIRLVKEGPKWEVKNNKKTKATVIVKF